MLATQGDRLTSDSTDIRVRPMKDADAPAWDQFVFATAGSTFFHRAGWRAIFSDVFHHSPHYLLAERSGQIVGVLPLVHQRSMLFGRALISLPFCVEGGTLAIDDAVRDKLDRAAITLMEETGSPYLELRSRKSARENWQVKKDLYATFSRPISSDDNANLLAIPRKQRAVLRKSLAGPLISEIDSNPDRLFRVYSESVRNLGTPVFSKRYFGALKRVFGKDCDIVVILEGNEPVSAVLNFYFKETVMPYYGGGTRAARRTGANDLLYWEVMRRAAARGYRIFDFGRSKAETGAFAFKKNWGFEPQWLEYEYYLRPGADIPNKNPNNPRYAAFIEIWKRLPLPIANTIGPLLVRGLG